MPVPPSFWSQTLPLCNEKTIINLFWFLRNYQTPLFHIYFCNQAFMWPGHERISCMLVEHPSSTATWPSSVILMQPLISSTIKFLHLDAIPIIALSVTCTHPAMLWWGREVREGEGGCIEYKVLQISALSYNPIERLIIYCHYTPPKIEDGELRAFFGDVFHIRGIYVHESLFPHTKPQ